MGWYFNSDEPFAEVTYHYGRWYEDPEQGWVWVADTKWAPAWVEWRRNKEYVGSPVAPENAPRRTSRTVVRNSAPDFLEEEWIFVPANRIVESRVETVMIRREQVVAIYSQTEVVGSVQERGGIYVNLALQPTVLQREPNVTIQSRNLPQAQAVPVPAQVQQISTESRTTASVPAAATTAPSTSKTSTAPAATPGPSMPAATSPSGFRNRNHTCLPRSEISGNSCDTGSGTSGSLERRQIPECARICDPWGGIGTERTISHSKNDADFTRGRCTGCQAATDGGKGANWPNSGSGVCSRDTCR